jgi:inosine/xanthosine triphosphate pyrophosphatase family protein
VFIPAGEASGRTMAQLADAEKDEISHRGAACRRLLEWLEGRPGGPAALTGG